jgi:hypothetical protein
MRTLTMVVVFLVPPIVCAVRSGARGCVVGILLGWILFGLCVELSWVSCRPGFEPLSGFWPFCMGLPVFASAWLAVFGLTKLLVALKRKAGSKSNTDD